MSPVLGFAAFGSTASRLSDSSQRLLMAFMVLALLFALLLPAPLLNEFTGYAEPGGMPLLKFHFYTYALFLALLLVTLAVGLVRFTSEQAIEQPGVLQFAAVIVLCASLTIVRQGVSGVANMANTMLTAPLAVMLVFYLNEERRRKLTALIIGVVTINAALAICERFASTNLFVFPNMGGFEYFRATALMGHPLENALITASMVFLVVAMPWSVWRKGFVLLICLGGILAFGARGALSSVTVVAAGAALFFGLRALLFKEMRLSTVVAIPWLSVLIVMIGAALTFGTVLGDRVVGLAKFDVSAQARVYAFRLFDYLSPSDILYGVHFAEINFLLKRDPDLNILENCWIALLLMLGAILFTIFVLSLLGFFWSMMRGRSAVVFFAVLNFVLVASTNNSLSVNTPSLLLFSVAMAGIPRRSLRRHSMLLAAKDRGDSLRFQESLMGSWL
jgi:hypothetical protein